MLSKRVLVLNVAGLAPHHLDAAPNLRALARRGAFAPMRPSFPAVTCTVQATLTTGRPPREHGIVGNGWCDRTTWQVAFWEQPASLVQAPRVWDLLKVANPQATTAVLFWQQSMYANADIVLTPRPLHLEGKMVQWCYSKPVGYYEELARDIGPFKLQTYWGPVTSIGSSRWIASATIETLRRHRPTLTLVYLPHLDYAAQKFGPDSSQSQQGLTEVDSLIGEITSAADVNTAIIICSEYSLQPVNGALFPNLALRRAGLFRYREIGGYEYPDFEMSRAFAVVDHQVAHIYVKDGFIAEARKVLENLPAVQALLDRDEQKKLQIDHQRSGELVALSAHDKWFAYYWWEDVAKAPPFSTHVDIHRKPGYDPCDLFFDWTKLQWPPAISRKPEKIRSSHGLPLEYGGQPAVCLLAGAGVESAKLPAMISDQQITPTILKLLGVDTKCPAPPLL